MITSGKDTFCGGADLTMLETQRRDYEALRKQKGEEAAVTMVFERSRKLSQVYRKLETSGKPLVAALNGTAMGGASSSRSPAITASPPTIRRRGSACRRSRSGCSPAPAARSASRA